MLYRDLQKIAQGKKKMKRMMNIERKKHILFGKISNLMDFKLIKRISFIATGNITSQALRAIFWIVVVWVMTSKDYGYVRYALTIATFLSIPVTSGFAATITRFIGKHSKEKDLRDLYGTHAIILDSISALVLILSGLLLGLITSENIFLLATFFVLILFIYSMYYATIRGLMNERKIVAYSVLTGVFRLLFIGLFWFSHRSGFFYVLFAYSIPPLVAILICELVKGERIKLKGINRRSINTDIFKELTRFAIPGIISATIWTVIGSADILFVKSFLGLEKVAYYSVSKTFVSVIGFVGGAIIVLQMPKVANFKKNKEAIARYTKKALFLGTATSMILGLGLYIFTYYIILYLFPAEYINSVYPIYILIPGSIFGGLYAILGATWSGYGRPDVEAKILFIGAIVFLPLNFVLVPIYGMLGAALVYSVSQCLVFMVILIKTFREFLSQH